MPELVCLGPGLLRKRQRVALCTPAVVDDHCVSLVGSGPPDPVRRLEEASWDRTCGAFSKRKLDWALSLRLSSGPGCVAGASGKSIKLSKLSSTEEWDKRRIKGRRSIRNLVMNVRWPLLCVTLDL